MSELPADQEVLQASVEALAGVGATVRVDGLTSGGLPPAALIQQIRIRQNSYDAEFHDPSPSFVEIITSGKPMPWHGMIGTTGRLGALRARNAFNPDAPAAQQEGLNANVVGNIANRASVTFWGNYGNGREDQPLVAQLPTGDARGLVKNPYSFGFATVRIGLDGWHHQNVRIESDYQRNANANAGAGGFNLPERGYDRDQTTVRLRGFWTAPLANGGSQTLRVQLQRYADTSRPETTSPAVVVLNAFATGGRSSKGRASPPSSN